MGICAKIFPGVGGMQPIIWRDRASMTPTLPTPANISLN
jgi:hypothetical protein